MLFFHIPVVRRFLTKKNSSYSQTFIKSIETLFQKGLFAFIYLIIFSFHNFLFVFLFHLYHLYLVTITNIYAAFTPTQPLFFLKCLLVV